MNDLISRQAAIDALDGKIEITGRTNAEAVKGYVRLVKDRLERLPPAQPDIIQCRNCKFASGDSRICMKFGHSPIGELDFCAWAERRTDE